MKVGPFINSVCLIGLIILGMPSCKKSNGGGGNEGNDRTIYSWNSFIMGADLSSINAVEDHGGHFTDSGRSQDVFSIFRKHGANLVRVRLWNDPQWQAAYNNGRLYSNLPDVEMTIQRAKQNGMAVLLDFHYSDTWADPANQSPPAAWSSTSFTDLQDSVYQYTFGVLMSLKSKNLVPEIVQLGNEINTGMLFPQGKVQGNNWYPFGRLLNSAIAAVRDFTGTQSIPVKIMLHVAQFQDADFWLNGLINEAGVTDFDMIGVSHYFPWSALTTNTELGKAVKALRIKYGREVIIAETAYPWTASGNDNYANIISGSTGASGYPVTAAGQYLYMHDLTRQVMAAGGKGVIYWEPAWISSNWTDPYGTGSPWENNAFFDFSGNSLPVMDFMSDTYDR